MYNISFMTCITQYIGHKSLEDQTLSGQNGCLSLTPCHFLTQPPNLGLWLSRSSLVFVCFGQDVTRTTSHVNIQQIVTRTQSYVVFKFIKYVIFIQSMKRTIQSCIYFSYFFYEKISGDFIPLTQKERCSKRYSNIFFEEHFFFEVSHRYLERFFILFFHFFSLSHPRFSQK